LAFLHCFQSSHTPERLSESNGEETLLVACVNEPIVQWMLPKCDILVNIESSYQYDLSDAYRTVTQSVSISPSVFPLSFRSCRNMFSSTKALSYRNIDPFGTLCSLWFSAVNQLSRLISSSGILVRYWIIPGPPQFFLFPALVDTLLASDYVRPTLLALASECLI
jgi:hypothetical protein